MTKELPRFLFVASLFALGCAAASSPRRSSDPEPDEPSPDVPEPPEKLTTLSFQCSPGDPLYEDAVKAASTWSAALGRTLTVSPDGDIPILLVAELDPGCQAVDTTGSARGCSRVMADLRDSFTQIPERIHWSVRYGVLLHEMGHHLRGGSGHVTTNPEAVMTSARKLGNVTLLPEDIDFVCTGPRFSCNLPSAA